MDIYHFLAEHNIPYERYDHPPVLTCEEAEALCPAMPETAVKTKNLFLRDKPGRRHFLVTVAAQKRVDVKALQNLIGVAKLSFASPQRLQTYLGLTPGSVTLLAALQDSAQAVEVVIDAEVWQADAIRCHPLVNTSTLVIARDEMRRFLELTGHPACIIEVPEKDL